MHSPDLLFRLCCAVLIISVTLCSTTIAQTTASEFNAQGNGKQSRQDYRGAIGDYDRAITLDPSFWAAFYNRGRAYQAEGKDEEALADYNRAIELNPEQSLSYLYRGNIKRSKLDLQGAIADYDRAIGGGGPDTRDAHFGRAQARQEKGDMIGAIADYDSALLSAPEWGNALYMRGLAHQMRGHHRAAIADFDQLMKLFPHFEQGEIVRRQRALAVVGHNLEKKGGEFYQNGLEKYKKGDKTGALSDWGLALDLDPWNTDLWQMRGLARMEVNDIDGAIADFTQALQLSPASAETYERRARAKALKKDVDGTIADSGQAIKLEPGHLTAHVIRATAKAHKGDLEGSIADYSRAIELDSSQSYGGAIYQARAYAKVRAGKRGEALADLRSFCERSGKDQAYARLQIWLLRTRAGEEAAASQELANYVNKHPDVSTGWVAAVAEYLLNEMSEEKLFAATAAPEKEKEHGQFTEAWYYTGMKKLLAGDTATAAAHFRNAVATGTTAVNEYGLASSELAGMSR